MVGPQYQAIIPSLSTHTFYERGECLLLSGELYTGSRDVVSVVCFA